MRVPYIIINKKGDAYMSNQTAISKVKIELMKKIINAHLTKEEMQAITQKANDIMQSRENA
jgi:phosphoribosylcarboxyaminoimidazole (NCAIR) mutase